MFLMMLATLAVNVLVVRYESTEGRRLRKTRYDVPYGDHVIEVDIYAGSNKGLIVAEVEFGVELTTAGP